MSVESIITNIRDKQSSCIVEGALSLYLARVHMKACVEEGAISQ